MIPNNARALIVPMRAQGLPLLSAYEENGQNTDRQQIASYSLSFGDSVTHRIVMPIRPENRWLYPIYWRQLSVSVRFDRAGARCEHCARPHMRRVAHLGDGRWWDADAKCWRSARGKRITIKGGFALAAVRTTYVVLACAHLDHEPGNSSPANLAALCQLRRAGTSR
jgi:hypothetical protein